MAAPQNSVIQAAAAEPYEDNLASSESGPRIGHKEDYSDDTHVPWFDVLLQMRQT